MADIASAAAWNEIYKIDKELKSLGKLEIVTKEDCELNYGSEDEDDDGGPTISGEKPESFDIKD